MNERNTIRCIYSRRERGHTRPAADRSLRRGALMLVLLVGLVFLALAASQLLPEYATIEVRSAEVGMKSSLSNLRSALDLERTLGTQSPCLAEYQALLANPDDRTRLTAYLQALQQRGFLANQSPPDPLVPGLQWASTSAQLMYWQAYVNLAQPGNASVAVCSFEAGGVDNGGVFSPTGWVNGLNPSNAIATLSSDTPTQASVEFDDYPGQNRLGNCLGTSGWSLRIEAQ